jgi:hypothetical protein
MKKITWILGALLLVFSSCNQLPTPSTGDSQEVTVSPQAANCNVPDPPPACDGLPVTPPPPPPRPPALSNKAFIQLNQLKVVGKQESFGDEPYFVTVGFRSRFLTANSTQTFWNGNIDGGYFSGFFSGLGTGAIRTLPLSMNGVSFANLKRVSKANILAGQMPEIIGAITVSLEDDLTSDGVMTGLMNNFAAALKTTLVDLIERGQLDLANPEASIRQAIAQLQSSLEPSLWQKIKIFLGSLGDPDDVIGFHAYVYAVTDNSVSFTAPINSLLSAGVLPYGDSPFTARYQGDGATYDVSSNVKYVPGI